MKLNNREDLTPICATENVPLFVMYIKKELTDKHKSKLEAHLSLCSDCKINLAYVEEILKFKHPTSVDEKTLLLRYLSDPLFYYFINDFRKKVLNDIKEIVKEVNIEDKNNKNIEKNKDKKILKPLNQKASYSYTVMTVAIAVFLSLSSLIVLGLGVKYPALQSYLPFSKQDSLSVNTANNLSPDLSINLTKTTQTNRYQQLDTVIDEFLATQDRQHLTKAETIAKDIKLFYEDNYGVDLVSYYQSVPESTRNNLLIARKKLQKLINESSGDKYQEHLFESQTLEKTFLGFGNLLESYKAKALTNKLNVQLHKTDDAKKIAHEGLNFSLNNKYLYLQLDFLLWEAKRFSKIPDFLSAEDKFIQTIDLATKLNLQKVRNSAGASLATIYYQTDDNEKAFNLAKKLLLLNVDNYKSPQIIGLLQIAGLSSFNLGYYQLSESYLIEAVKNSKEINSPAFIIRSYAFLGLIFAEQKKFAQAEEFYAQAKEFLNNITETKPKLEALAVIIGYQAKAKLLINDNQQAIALYQQKLDIMKEIKLESNLETSQIHQAMATALVALGESKTAKEHSTIAKYYQSLAKNNNEIANCLLSLAPTKCGLAQQ